METAITQSYLELYHNKEVSTHTFSALLGRYGKLAKAIEKGCRSGLVPAARHQDATVSELIEADLRWAEKAENLIVCFESADYPPLLRHIDSPPPLLYVEGDKELLASNQLAIVGSRKATTYGRRHAYWLAYEIGQAGFTICSGLARGIDTEAHQAALEASARTVAVLGTGIDVVYPTSNRALAEKIKQQGALVSEFPRGTRPLPANFPRRNRIISGLSAGTLVIEASQRSGSLITARLALEQNREVFALPGPVSSSMSSGCHRLLKQGAKLVETPGDILEELSADCLASVSETAYTRIAMNKAEPAAYTLTHQQQQILAAIGEEECLLETIKSRTEMALPELTSNLALLEVNGQIEAVAGRYSRAF